MKDKRTKIMVPEREREKKKERERERERERQWLRKEQFYKRTISSIQLAVI